MLQVCKILTSYKEITRGVQFSFKKKREIWKYSTESCTSLKLEGECFGGKKNYSIIFILNAEEKMTCSPVLGI